MSLLTGTCISFFGNTFWMSLTVCGMFFMATLWSGNQRFWSNQTIKNFITDNRSLEMNTTHVTRHRQTLARKAQWTKEPPTPTKASMAGARLSWSMITVVKTKIQKSCWKYTWSSLKYDSVSGKMRQVLAQAFKLIKRSNVGKFVQCTVLFTALSWKLYGSTM